MKYWKSLLCFIAVVYFVACSPEIRLIYNSDQIDGPSADTLQIKRVRTAWRSNSLVVRLTNGQKLFIPADSVWGIAYNKKVVYRYYFRQYYQVRQVDSLVIYSKLQSHSHHSHQHYYFSKNTDSRIYSLNRENLRKEFRSDTCFLKCLDTNFKWYEGYSTYDKSTKSYRIVDLYKKCNAD